jgi:hypothetical protein
MSKWQWRACPFHVSFDILRKMLVTSRTRGGMRLTQQRQARDANPQFTDEKEASYVLGRNFPRRSPARLVAHDDIHVVVHSVQAPKQTIDGESADATDDKSRDVRLLETEHGGSLGLGKFPAFDNGADLANKLGLEKIFFRVTKTEAGKNIVVARGHFSGGAHFFLLFRQVDWPERNPPCADDKDDKEGGLRRSLSSGRAWR